MACKSEIENKFQVFAQPDRIEISEQEMFFNEKQRSPLLHEIPKDIHQREQQFVSKIAQANSGIDWYLRGPQNVGGRTRALALDVKNSNRVVVGGVSGGVWISEDLGLNFEKATTPQQFHSVTCIAQDSRAGKEKNWYYGTGEQNGNSADLLGNGIYKSTDNGLTWSVLENTTNTVANTVSTLGDFRYVRDIKVNPVNGHIAVASFTGIWLSTDEGLTWTNARVGGADPNGFGYVNFGKQTNIDISPEGVYYATLSSDCVNKGIWRSEDGVNWTNITPVGFPNFYRRIESSISELDENQVFFIADIATTVPLADNHQLWKYKHADTGGNWLNKTANLPAGTCTGFYDFDFGYFQSQNSYDLYIAVHPSDTNLIYLGGTNLYRSTDGFSTPAYDWIGGYFCDPADPGNYVFPNHHPDNHAAVFIPNSTIMISAHDGGLSKTMNCKASSIVWESINNGYNTSQFYTVAIEHGNVESDFIIGGMQDNGTFMTNSLNANQDWMYTFYGDGAYCAIAEGRENYYISWQGGKTFKAQIDDNGTVQNITRIDPSAATGFQFINPFILDPTDNNKMILSAGKYLWLNDSLNHIPNVHDEFVTNDLGWKQLALSNVQGITLPGAPTAAITALAMSKANGDVVYYGTNLGSVFKFEGLQTGTYAKTAIKGSNMPSSAFVSCVAAHEQDANKVMVTFSNYEVKSIFYSEDAGTSWTDVSGNLEEFENGSGAGPSVNWVEMYYDGTKTIYLAGTTSGLFSTESLDAENTVWAREGLDIIGNVPIAIITSRSFDKNLVVATHGNGIFSNKEFISSTQQLAKENASFYLSNVSPNPVKEKMKFSFRIATSAQVKIGIYDIMGKHIENISNEKLAAGTYEKRWFKKENLPRGIYFLIVDVNGKKQSKQFVIEL